MNNTVVEIVSSDLGTFIFTVFTSVYLMGKNRGQADTSIASDISSIKERLARIEAMFELRLKQDRRDNLP